MKIKKGLKLFSVLMFVLMGINSAQASRLPDDVWAYVKEQLPNATQRFDSVVVLNNSTMYVPLYPAQRNDVEKIALDYTYPKVSSIKSLPEVFILNNNYVLNV